MALISPTVEQMLKTVETVASMDMEELKKKSAVLVPNIVEKILSDWFDTVDKVTKMFDLDMRQELFNRLRTAEADWATIREKTGIDLRLDFQQFVAEPEQVKEISNDPESQLEAANKKIKELEDRLVSMLNCSDKCKLAYEQERNLAQELEKLQEKMKEELEDAKETIESVSMRFEEKNQRVRTIAFEKDKLKKELEEANKRADENWKSLKVVEDDLVDMTDRLTTAE